MSTSAVPVPPRLLPGAGDPLAVARQSSRGIGRVILKPDSPDLISGVGLQVGALWPDDRGYFTELFRLGSADPFVSGFSPQAQVSAALSFAGTIKAVHFHRRQTDLWAPVNGQFQVLLVDLRPLSPSFGRINTFYLGEWRPWRLRIPPGVGHGYKVVGETAALLIYATDRYYDPNDEGRIPYNDPDLNYDWERQHK